MRQLLAILILVAALLVPSVGAQVAVAEITYRFQEPSHAVYLNESGRARHEFVIAFTARGFVCDRPLEFEPVLALASFHRWAGSSLEPRTKRVTFSPPGPGLVQQTREVTFGMHFAWDLDGAPRDASENYTIYVHEIRPVASLPPPCIPMPTFRVVEHKNHTLSTCIDPGNNATGCGRVATADPNTGAEPGLAIPFLPPSLFIVAAAALVFVLRRRQSKAL